MKNQGCPPFMLLFLLLPLSMYLASKAAQHLFTSSFFNKPSSNFGSTVVFPVGGRVYPDGYFFSILHIGQPPKPYHFDIDTGSDLTWVQCDAPCVHCLKAPHAPYKPIENILLCKDPFCSLVEHPPNRPCNNPADRCDYQIEYADHGSSLGVLLHDLFHLRLANRSHLHMSLGFGCGYDQKMLESSHRPFVDGVLGLANGKSSILSQLRGKGVVKNLFGHCFSGKGGGYLFFGDTRLPSSGVVWVPVTKNSLEKYYTIGPAELVYDDEVVMDSGLSLVFDSGSTFTYLTKEVHKNVICLIKKMIDSNHLKEAPEDETLPVCWKGPKPFKSISDVEIFFKPLAIRFKSPTNAAMRMLPQHYLIITEQGNVCFAILDSNEAGLGDLNILGDVSLQDRLVIYDNEKRRIGWVSKNCSEPLNDELSGFAVDLGLPGLLDRSDEL